MTESNDLHETPEQDAGSGVNRRRAIKLGVGVGVGAVVWTEPYIVGLTRRPSYASAASVADIVGSTSFGPADPDPFPYTETNADGFTITISQTADGYSFALSIPDFDCTITGGTFSGNGSGAPNIGDEPLVLQGDGTATVANNRPFNGTTARDFAVTVNYTCVCL